MFHIKDQLTIRFFDLVGSMILNIQTNEIKIAEYRYEIYEQTDTETFLTSLNLTG